MRDNLQAEGRAKLERLDFGGFDPLRAFVRQDRAGNFLQPRRTSLPQPAEIAFGISDRQITVANQQINVEGANLLLEAMDAGADIGVKVTGKVREHDTVYRVTE